MAKSNKVSRGAYERGALTFDGVIYLGFKALFLKLGKEVPLIVSRGHRERLVGKSMTGLKLKSRYLQGMGAAFQGQERGWALEIGEEDAKIIGKFGDVVREQRQEAAASAGQNLQNPVN